MMNIIKFFKFIFAKLLELKVVVVIKNSKFLFFLFNFFNYWNNTFKFTNTCSMKPN